MKAIRAFPTAAILLFVGVRGFAKTAEPRVLNDLLARIHDSIEMGEQPMVLFDIDDTLTNTDGRHRRIIGEFLEQPEIAARFPEDSAKLRAWVDCTNGCRPLRFELKETLRDAGVQDAAFVSDLTTFWSPDPAHQVGRFFSNDYLTADTPNPGAAEFVKAVIAAGATAAYFTGRKQALMPGTLAVFRKYGFPVPGEDPGAVLFLKQDANQSDVDFKAAKIRELRAAGAVIVGGFDNEPANINAFRREGPAGSVMIFLDTKHSSAPIEVAPDIPWVKDFVRPVHPAITAPLGELDFDQSGRRHSERE